MSAWHPVSCLPYSSYLPTGSEDTTGLAARYLSIMEHPVLKHVCDAEEAFASCALVCRRLSGKLANFGEEQSEVTVNEHANLIAVA